MEAMRIILIYFLLVLSACVGTCVFLLYHHVVYDAYPAADLLNVICHSIPQHLTVAGYVMALPLLLGLVLIWMPRCRAWYGRFMAWYMAVMSLPLVVGWLANMVLYGYWGIVLDGTALIYLLDNPADALAEAPAWTYFVLLIVLVVVFAIVYRGTKRLYGSQRLYGTQRRNANFPSSQSSGHRFWQTLGMLLLCGLDFLAIRGGWTPATMNPGRAYFCSEMPLNHAAVDPVFNFLYSLSKNERFDRQYRFMTDEEAQTAIRELNEATVGGSGFQSSDTLLRVKRPHILLVLLESFSGTACRYLTPEADDGWMPNVNRAMEEGVAFTQFYANSFRTDRGVAATLASYPGQPTNSVMKDQSKCDNLQYMSKRLGEHGYSLQFIHGGDVNFTNMKGFLRAGGIVDIVGDTDFPLSQRLDKWGVRDDMMFDYVAQQVIAKASAGSQAASTFTAFLSLSSHEPFEVPFHHYDDIYLNSVAYADSCLGAMIQTLKARPEVWDNLLVIGLPDHCYARFPAGIQQHEPRRYHIPMFWTGGAVCGHREVSVIGQQTDLAATLFAQLGIDAADFCFSKDMLSPQQGHYAFYAFSDGFGLITDSCQYVQDNNQSGKGLQPGTHDPKGKAERWGKAYLQTLYDDLQKR